jgi:hypothetical protein
MPPTRRHSSLGTQCHSIPRDVDKAACLNVFIGRQENCLRTASRADDQPVERIPYGCEERKIDRLCEIQRKISKRGIDSEKRFDFGGPDCAAPGFPNQTQLDDRCGRNKTKGLARIHLTQKTPGTSSQAGGFRQVPYQCVCVQNERLQACFARRRAARTSFPDADRRNRTNSSSDGDSK